MNHLLLATSKTSCLSNTLLLRSTYTPSPENLLPPTSLLPKLPQRCLLIVVLVEDLGRRQVEILLRHVNPSLPERIHTCFGAYSLELRPRASVHLLCDLRQVDPARQVHRPRVDP